MRPRSAIASRSSPEPSIRAVAAGSGPLKKIQTCAPDSGSGHLQRSGRADRPSRLEVGQRVEHGRRAVEICGEPAETYRRPAADKARGVSRRSDARRRPHRSGRGTADSCPSASRRRPPAPILTVRCARSPTASHTRRAARRIASERIELCPAATKRRRLGRVDPGTFRFASPPADAPAAASTRAAGASVRSPPAGGPTPRREPARPGPRQHSVTAPAQPGSSAGRHQRSDVHSGRGGRLVRTPYLRSGPPART